LPARVHEVYRAEEVTERRRAHSIDHAGLEVEKHRAWHVLAARSLEVQNADAVELRVVVTAVLAVAADAVFIAQYLLKLGAHLVTSLASLHVHNHARRSSLEDGSKREKKGGEERRNARNSVWEFGTGNRKCRWQARLYL
jgi:hypothetical protein